MNRIFRNVASLSLAGLMGAVALLPARAAFADDAGQPQVQHHRHGHREGLLGAALQLDSISASQHTAIEQLVAERRTAEGPVRQADAQVLEVLAHQVEQASVDLQGLAPTLNVEKGAVAAEGNVERDVLNHLHGILTPAQRGQVADALEARFHGHGAADAGAPGGERGGNGHGLGLTDAQKAQIRANLQAEAPLAHAGRTRMHDMLEAFRGDSFDASAFVNVVAPGQRAERLAQAMVPVLTPAQRATLAARLRARASHESRS